jgi:hypothetical protein
MGRLPKNVVEKIGALGHVPTISELGLKYKKTCDAPTL